MTDKFKEDIIAARVLLVEQRRALIANIADKSSVYPARAANAADLKKLQDGIEALDSAFKDEKIINPEKSYWEDPQ